jgi:hypothetical protein
MTEYTATMQARTRVVWLTDHPGCTVADFERVKAPSPRTAAARREHSAYLDWINSARVRRLIGLPVMAPDFRAASENADFEKRFIERWEKPSR